MSLIDIARDTLKGLPVSDILRERLSLALDLAAQSESKVEAFRTENAGLKAKLENITIDRDKTREELQRLKNDHAEEIIIHRMVEFRRGKRTGGKWLAFCPKCHLPAGGQLSGNGRPIAYCPAICGWTADLPFRLDDVIKELDSKDG